MLRIVIPESEYFNTETAQFVTLPEKILELEHSLRSLSRWEARYKIPFLAQTELTREQLYFYVYCMCQEEIGTGTLRRLTNENFESISNYIGDEMTATTFPDSFSKPSREKITSELVYYWMIAAQIPFECQDWHLNRLLTLIRVVNVKSQPPEKMSKAEIAKRNRELNEKRRAQLGTRG